MRTVFIIAGAVLVVTGSLQLRRSLQNGRRGGSWRGDALTAGAFAVYGVLALSGVLRGTLMGALLIWVVAIAALGGLWLSRRETARSAG